MSIYHSIESSKSTAGAIAMIRVVHPDPASTGLVDPKIGTVRLGKLLGIDEGVIVRWDEDSIVLMPHGGIAIVRAISKALTDLGVPIREDKSPLALYPEAQTEIEAWMLFALSKAQSPLAIDVLLDQPKRWLAIGVETIADAKKAQGLADADHDHNDVLGRLINAPMVAAVGRANVGKSTLINTLVGEHVALVADVAGTTRDHVGVLVDLGGLVVRWIDTPGIDERIADGEEIELASRVVAQADLIVHCIDSGDDDGQLDGRLKAVIADDVPMLRVGMRADLGSHGCSDSCPEDNPLDVIISIDNQGRGDQIESLVTAIKESLVPAMVLQDPRPWRFWDSLGF